MTRGELLSQLAVLLGGRTAEEIALGEISTGAQNDLQRATDIARAMVTEFGMSDELGAINYDGNKRARFLDIPMPQERGLYAEETAQRIDAEIKRILDEGAQHGAPGPDGEPRDARDRHAPPARNRSHGRRRAARTRLASPSLAAPLSTAASPTSARLRGSSFQNVIAIAVPIPCTTTTSATHAGQPPRSQSAAGSADRRCRRRSRTSNTSRPRARDRASSPRRCGCWSSPAR